MHVSNFCNFSPKTGFLTFLVSYSDLIEIHSNYSELSMPRVGIGVFNRFGPDTAFFGVQVPVFPVSRPVVEKSNTVGLFACCFLKMSPSEALRGWDCSSSGNNCKCIYYYSDLMVKKSVLWHQITLVYFESYI